MRSLALLKLLATAVLTAGTLGLLWHQTQTSGMWGGGDYFHKYFHSPTPPAWLPPIHGWFPKSATTIYWVFGMFPVDAIFYVLTNILCVIGIFCIPFVKNTSVRAATGLAALSIFAYELTILDISGSLPTAATTQTMLMNARFGLEGSISPYLRDIVKNVGCVALLAVAILWPPQALSKNWKHVPAGILLLACMSVAFVQYRQRPGLYAPHLPTPFGSALHLFEAWAPQNNSPFAPPVYARPFGQQIEKVVVIMDESVRGGYATSRAFAKNGMPFLPSNLQRIADFGISAASANCSIDARLSFRHMLRQSEAATPINDLIKMNRATIWQYARHAGYETVHFDAFGSPITLTSGMGRVERALVDKRIAVMDLPHYNRDKTIAQRLRAMLAEPGRQFVFVEKYGAHVPYTNTYPRDKNIFGADMSKDFNLTDQVEMVKHYRNALHWTVDTFFSDLLAAELPRDTLIIYTSDHGQSLSEGGIKLSHCSFDGTLRTGEAAVPLFTFSTDAVWQKALQTSADRNADQTSHYQIAPTLLLAMGYDRSWTNSQYDDSLLAALPPNKKWPVRFGRQAVEFQPDKMAGQPLEPANTTPKH
jgi:glucan phosphoethanolaminetransferase (alkaline phosphatase superfamily)